MKKYSHIIGAAVLLLSTYTMAIPVSAQSDSFAEQNESVSCLFDENTGVFTASGSGVLTYANTKGIHKKIKQVIIGDGITTIGMEAFANCPNLESITLPDTLVNISTAAFQNCTALETVAIPTSVDSISANAFSLCTSLENITIPDTLTNIGWNAFAGTAWLKEKQQADALVTVNGVLIDGHTAEGTVEISDNVIRIAEGAFSNCEALKQVIVPESVAQIDGWAFFGCTSLEKITILNAACNLYTNADMLKGSNPDVILCSESNSTLEAYASQYGYKFEKITSINLNDVLTALETYNLTQLGITPSAEKYAAADADGDGTLNLNDVLTLLHTYSFYNLLNY